MRAVRGALVLLGVLLLLATAQRRAFSRQPLPEKITDGNAPWLSPDGKRLAFMRVGLDKTERDVRGQPVRVALLHIRDLTTGKERKAARNGEVTGWSGSELVVFRDGTSLRVAGKGEEPVFAAAPKDLQTPAWVRSRDGTRVAYTVRGFTMQDMSPTKPPKGREHTIHLVVGKEAPKPLALDEYVNNPQSATGLLSFSPDGRHLAFRLGFMHYGQLPHPRIGVVDLVTDEVAWIADESAGSRGRGSWRTAGPNARGAWDARGTRFVFVKAAGAKKRDLYASTADGEDVRRLTKDGQWKQRPCLDPAGDRCAYWVRDPNDAEAHALRVLMLRTGAIQSVTTPGAGAGSNLQWSADGKHLWFAWSTKESTAIWRAPAPPAPKVPEGTEVINRTTSKADETLEALNSEDPDEAEAALRREWNNPDPKVTQAMVDMLRRWVTGERGGHVWTVVQILRHRKAVGAIPALLDGLTERHASAVTPLLLDWNVKDGIPKWRHLAKSKEFSPKGHALVALAHFGDAADWERVREQLKHEDPDARAPIARALGHVRDPRAVEILIGLLDDKGRLYTTSDGEVQVRHHAADSLKQLGGRSFGPDKSKWTTWWNEVGKKLPDRKSSGR